MEYLEPGTEVWVYDQSVLLDGIIDCRHNGFQDDAYYVNVKQVGGTIRKLLFRQSIYVKTTDRERLVNELNSSISYLQAKIEKVMAE
jgi:asparagine synthetase A